MPYKSEAQRKYFNSPEGKKKIGSEEVEHWNKVSKGMKLPEKRGEDMNILDKAIKSCDMGMRNAAEIVPEHQKYNPEYTVDQFENKMKFFISQVNKGQDATSGFRQIKGICETVLNDYKADINNKNLDKSKTLAYYKKYRDVAYRLVNPKNVPGPIRAWVEDKFYIMR